MAKKEIAKYWCFFILAIVIIILLTSMIGYVDVGEVAVVVDPLAGTVWIRGDGSTASVFLKPPWAYSKRIYVATDTVHMWTEKEKTGEFPAIPVLTKDGLAVEVDITVRWKVMPGKALSLFKNYPLVDWRERAIIPMIRETVRNVIARYSAVETIQFREKIANEIYSQLDDSLRKEKTLEEAILLQEVDLREIALPPKFTSAIEEKLSAEQLAIAAEFQKQRVIILANATAESILKIVEATKSNTTEIAKLYMSLEAYKEMAKTGRVIVIVGTPQQYIIPLPEETSK
jgi:regulator of protease activity HflC (stomatin/prohibitin superfamily)